MDTDFPRMNTELNCAPAFLEAGSVIGIRVYPWEILGISVFLFRTQTEHFHRH
jgi:hypothetical protein